MDAWLFTVQALRDPRFSVPIDVPIGAERTLLSNRLTLTQAANQQVAASIHLIQALGGGWNRNLTPKG